MLSSLQVHDSTTWPDSATNERVSPTRPVISKRRIHWWIGLRVKYEQCWRPRSDIYRLFERPRTSKKEVKRHSVGFAQLC